MKKWLPMLLWLLCCIRCPAPGASLEPVKDVRGAFELDEKHAVPLRAIPLDAVGRAYGGQFALRERKLDVCSWDYANEYGLVRKLTAMGADLSGDKLSSYTVEPDFVAIDTQSGRVKFFADEDDTEIKVVGRARTLHGAPTCLAAHGDFAFLSNGEGGHNFQVIDGTDISRPYVCAALPCGNYARRVTYANGRAYYATSYTGIWIIDVSDPRHPKKLGLWKPAGDRLFDVRGGYAYGDIFYADAGAKPPEGTPDEKKTEYRGTFIVDLSDPTEPKTIGRLEGRGYLVQGDRLHHSHTVTGPDGQKRQMLDIYSLADPRRPKLLWSYPWVGGASQVKGDLLRCIHDRPKGKEHFYFLRTHLLVGPDENAVLADVPLSVEPFNVKKLGPVVFDGDTLYLISGQDLLVIDISDPRQPKLIGKCWSGPTTTMALGNQKMFCGGGRTYQFGESGVWIIDLRDPANPKRGGYAPTGGEGQNNWIGLNGKLCLAGGEWGGHNWVTDVSDRQNPRFLGTYFDRHFNGNNNHNIAVGNYFYMDDRDGTKILDLRVWEKYLGKADANFKPLVFDTYEYNPEVVIGLMQVRHQPVEGGGRGIDLYMARGSLTSKPFAIPAGDYVLRIRYRGHRAGAHPAVRVMLIEGGKPVYDTQLLSSRGPAWVDEKLSLSVDEGIGEARVHLTGCDASVDEVSLTPKGAKKSLVPNGDFEHAGTSPLQAPGWEVGGPRHQWWGRLPPEMGYNGVLCFEDRIYYVYGGRRLYVFDSTTDPATLLTPGGVLLRVKRNISNFCVRGSLLYVIHAPEHLTIYDISDLRGPRLVADCDREALGMEVGQFQPYGMSGWVGPHYGVAVSKGLMACGERYHFKEAYLHVLDVSNPRKPKWLTRVPVTTKQDAMTECWGYRKLIQMGIVAPLGIILDGGRWLYTAEYWSGAKIFDLRDPKKPKLFYNEIAPFQALEKWEDRATLIPDDFFYLPGYTVNAWCGGEVWGHHVIATRLSHCAVLKVPRVSQAPKRLSLEFLK